MNIKWKPAGNDVWVSVGASVWDAIEAYDESVDYMIWHFAWGRVRSSGLANLRGTIQRALND